MATSMPLIDSFRTSGVGMVFFESVLQRDARELIKRSLIAPEYL